MVGLFGLGGQYPDSSTIFYLCIAEGTIVSNYDELENLESFYTK